VFAVVIRSRNNRGAHDEFGWDGAGEDGGGEAGGVCVGWCFFLCLVLVFMAR
jgi:hypothetical protein